MIGMPASQTPAISKITPSVVWQFGQHIPGLEDRAIFYLAYLAGCKLVEALQVQVKDIRTKSCKIQGGRLVKMVCISLPEPERTVYIYPANEDRLMLAEIKRHLQTRLNKLNVFEYCNKPSYVLYRCDVFGKKHAYIQYRVHSLIHMRINANQAACHLSFKSIRAARAHYWGNVCGFTTDELRSFMGWHLRSAAECYVKAQPRLVLTKLVMAAEKQNKEVSV